MKKRTIGLMVLAIAGVAGVGIAGGFLLGDDEQPAPRIRYATDISGAQPVQPAPQPLTTASADAELNMLVAEHDRLEKQLTDLRTKHGLSGPIDYPMHVSLEVQPEQYNRSQLFMQISFLQIEISKLEK